MSKYLSLCFINRFWFLVHADYQKCYMYIYIFLQPEVQKNFIKNHHSTHQPIYCLHPSSFHITAEELRFGEGVCTVSKRPSWDRGRLYGQLMEKKLKQNIGKKKPSLLPNFYSLNYFRVSRYKFVRGDIFSRSNLNFKIVTVR